MSASTVGTGKQFPIELEHSLETAASRFGRALEALDWPNAGKNAPPAEANVVIAAASYLCGLPKPFELYAEATAGPGRVDLIGYNGEIAFAMEAKSFGAINSGSNSLFVQLRRLRTFTPSLTQELSGDLQANQWWTEAESRWAIILMASFRGREVRDAWISSDEESFRHKMMTYNKADRPQLNSDGAATGFLALYRAIPSVARGAARITTSMRWKDTAEAWLLWGGIQIE